MNFNLLFNAWLTYSLITISLTARALIATDHAIYEEVEAYNKHRPVLIFGALADQVASSLLESYPNLFYSCPTGRIT